MAREVWITGIGLTSSLGEGPDAHWRALTADPPKPVIDLESFAPVPVHAMVPLDLDKQIPRRADQRQMEPWQRLGTYSAGLALQDAGLAGDLALLDRTHMIVAATGGERDIAVDGAILEGLQGAPAPEEFLNERLSSDLRPTLFLAQLPNLLAGNISIVHKVTGSSRTFMGEEIAGVSAVEIAARRIEGGQGDIFLVGASWIASRKDLLLNVTVGGRQWLGEPVPVWARPERGGGMIFGSMGAFLVLEAREHAEGRGRKPYARMGPVLSDRSQRRPGEAAATAARQFEQIRGALGGRPAPVLSGATGIAAPTEEERQFLIGLIETGAVDAVRAVATMIGSGCEAMFPATVALAALALSRKAFYPPFDTGGFERPASGAPERIVATCWGLWRGEGMGLVEAAD